MQTTTPETRPRAPGDLGRLQDFLNSGHLQAAAFLSTGAAQAIRERSAAGETDAALAREFGLSLGFVAALRRGAPVFDELETVADAQSWLAGNGFFGAGERLSADDLARIHELRELLRDLAAANNDHELPPGTIDALDALTRSAPLAVSFAGTSPGLVPAAGGRPALGNILAALFEATRDGSWARLKRCPGMGCPFTFYDASRNRTGTWCSMSVCGNRTKVRKYQERRRSRRG